MRGEDVALRGYWNITAINDLTPEVEWVGLHWHVIASTESEFS